MNILAINTSSTSGSIAIYKENKITFVCYLDITVTHSERLMYQIDTGLKESRLSVNQIDVILIANGPGSFTGLRIGLATAKGLSMPNKIPIIPYNSLILYAANLFGTELPILVMVDAKMNETYSAMYSKDLAEIIPPNNYKPQEILSQIDKKVILTGNGLYKFNKIIKESGIKYAEPLPHQNTDLATAMISLFLKDNIKPQYDFDFIASLEPYYLRKSQAELSYEKRKGNKNGK